MEGFQQIQLVLADKEVVKRKKNMEGEEKEVVKRSKYMQGEEGSQQLQLLLAEKEEHLLRFCETLITDTVIHRTRNQSWYANLDYYLKKDDESLMCRRQLAKLRHMQRLKHIELYWSWEC